MNSNLLEGVLIPENLRAAWKQVKQNDGAAGVDGITIEADPQWAKTHWPDIRRALEGGYQVPLPVRRVEIPKGNGQGIRPLGIPTVNDRLIQQAIAQVLTPLIDPSFSACSHGYRPGHSAHDAVKQVRGYIEQGYRVAVDVDVSKFFDRLNHDVLMARLAHQVQNKRVLKLIGRYLRAGVLIEGPLHPTQEGGPQGGPLSPLLANVVLDELDKYLESRGLRFARYCDDFVIWVKSTSVGFRVMHPVTRFLAKRLKLEVNHREEQGGENQRAWVARLHF